MRFIFILLISTSSLTLAQKTTIDLTSVDAYWQIVGELQRGQAVSDSTWSHFTKLAAVQLAVKGRSINLPLVRQALDIVYRPQNKVLYQTIVADSTKGFELKRYYVLLHANYQKNQKALIQYAQQARSGQLLTDAYRLTYQVLPPSITQHHKQVANLTLYCSPLFEGGYAENKTMMLGIESELAFKDKKPNVLVEHELHHLLRPTASMKADNSVDQRLLTVFERLLDEGSADLVGISPSFYRRIKLNQSIATVGGDDPFLWYLAGSDTTLANLNTILSQYAKTKDTTWVNAGRFVTLLESSGGHIPSGYMGHVIDRNGLRPQLVHQLANPFGFVLLYNQAAQRDPSKPPQFNAVVLEMIQQLQRKYWPRRLNKLY